MTSPDRVALRKKFGAELRRLRRIAGMTLDDTAKKSGASLGYISQIELGRNMPYLDVMLRLVLAVGGDPAAVVAALVAPDPTDPPTPEPT